MVTAKHRAIDRIHRNVMLERKQEELGRDLEIQQEMAAADFDAALDDDVGDSWSIRWFWGAVSVCSRTGTKRP